MTKVGFDRPLYILPFDHRGSFQTKMFGWKGTLTPEQPAEIAAAKQVIYDAFKAAVHDGVPGFKTGILVDEQFGGAILRDAAAHGYTTACPAEKSGQDEFDFDGYTWRQEPTFWWPGRQFFGNGGSVAEAMNRLRAERE